MWNSNSFIKSIACAGTVFLLGYAAGSWSDAPATAQTREPAREQTRDRRPAGREAFLAGGERAELVLREMQKTLEKMEGRLANIETATVALEKRTRP
jgi:arginine exporter protein ArgO